MGGRELGSNALWRINSILYVFKMESFVNYDIIAIDKGKRLKLHNEALNSGGHSAKQIRSGVLCPHYCPESMIIAWGNSASEKCCNCP